MSHHTGETRLGKRLTDKGQTVGGIGPAGAQNDLKFGPLAPRFLRKLLTVKSGHLNIGEQDFDALIRFDFCQCVRAAAGGHHLAAKVFQHRGGELQEEGFVIDHENKAGHGNLPGEPANGTRSAREVNKFCRGPFPFMENATGYTL